jgi:hypothetical protein
VKNRWEKMGLIDDIFGKKKPQDEDEPSEDDSPEDDGEPDEGDDEGGDDSGDE